RMVLKGTIRFAADVGRIQIGCEHPKHVELTFAQWFDQRLFDRRSGLSRVCQRSRGSIAPVAVMNLQRVQQPGCNTLHFRASILPTATTWMRPAIERLGSRQ